MSKKLCITTFVFGQSFQGYIPLFVYSVLRSYQDYFVLIFLQNRLSDEVREQLQVLTDLGKFEVEENYLHKHRLNNQQGKAVRWILDTPEFDEHEFVYIGDIDIFILPEDPPLHVQHERHCKVLGLAYSNVVRKGNNRKVYKGIRGLYDIYKNVGPVSMLRYMLQPQLQIKRLSGLHFLKTAEYFPKIRPLIEKYNHLILDRSYKSREATIRHKNGFNNECLLYDIIQESGLGLPPEVPYSMDYKDFQNVGFRPYHGLHLGIFKSDKDVKSNVKILGGNVYKEYYKKFCQMSEKDEVFSKLQEGFNDEIRQQFSRMRRFYSL